ncbi:MAG: amino acid adenylation domain-containing protein, partial [Gammaproteobacteria bacterium]|nr:amino acid adenylation domain-containing protein [Gammaproteobacteria bacterium]
ATQVTSQIRETFSVEVPLRLLFESPAIAGFSKYIETAQRDLQLNSAPSIKPIAREGELPLSYAQQRLWFLEEMEGETAAYNIPLALRCNGTLVPDVLQRSLREIVRRHENLRTVFLSADGGPIQRIAAELNPPLPVTDLQDLSGDQQAAEVRRLALQEAEHRFDLAEGPLLRTGLLHLNAEEHILFLTMHHIISDAWSLGVFMRELGALYEAYAADKPSPLPDLPIQYVDFAHWQRQWLSGGELEKQLDYWKKQLAGTPALLELPTDRPRPPVQTFRGKVEYMQIDAELTGALNQLSQTAGGTLFMTLLAAFAVLLHRYTGQEDIPVGSPIASRTRRELEGLIGFFVNTLVLRADLSGDPTFLTLLEQMRQISLDAYTHQDVPFEHLVEALKPERSISYPPLFQVMFTLQNTPMENLALENVSIILLPPAIVSAKFDINLWLEETAQGLDGTCEYNTDLFDASTIQRMLGNFHILLKGIVENPEQPVSRLPLLSKAERHQLLLEWNDTQVQYPLDKCIHQLIEEQAAKTPDAVAVVFKDEELTYAELNARTNQLAHYLTALGIRPDVLAGVYMERSLEMVVGLLGILKAGGAYVPVDPDYPKERVAFMLEDADMPVLLTQAFLKEDIPTTKARVLCLDADWEKIARESRENPDSGVTSKDLIYAIYTSGSTGKPKGAPNTHEALVNRILWMQDAYQLTPDDRILQKTPFSFDVSGWEFWWPLLTGCRLVMAIPGGHKDSAYLVKLIAEQKITTLHFVPSMLQMFLEEDGLKTCQDLKRVICSGEALPFDLQQRFFERMEAELHNLYGPTEAAIDVTCWQCSPDTPLQIVPIGKAIANTQLYILDKSLQPVPVGVPGELHLGGVGLARGYLNRPELTAEKFIPNPFSDAPEARLYKTGDLCRYLADGNIEYLRRIDFQIKIRGLRVELGEIETAIEQDEAVQQAVVIVREDQPGDKRLAAYIASKPQQLPTGTELRAVLKKKLPDYMVPAAFVMLDKIPLTPNGKVDRRALPMPESDRPELGTDYVVPQTETERRIAAVWSELILLEKVGVHDNFFELGGHSLLIVQVRKKLQEAFAQSLPVVELFQYPTIHALAEHLDRSPEKQPENQDKQATEKARKGRKAAAKRQRQRR